VSFDAETMYRHLPAIYRIRDAERGGPLRELLTVIAEQLAVMEENVEQLYDDLFIETCADWVVPYIGDLIGYSGLYGEALGRGSSRAEVGHTIALRRRKGTAAVLEQLARDVTGWNARSVEFFQTLATTQYMNHVRLNNHYAPDLRAWEPLERIGTAFDTVAHTVDVRRIASARGRHNIPNVGLFLFPVDAHAATRCPASRVDDRRWRVSPLNHDMPLYNRAEAEESITHLAEPVNVPMALSRRVLARDVASSPSIYYGEGSSVAVYINGANTPVARNELHVCDLSDEGGTWAHLPEAGIAIDPTLGRIALPLAPPEPITQIEVTHHLGFSAEIGGGEYERADSLVAIPGRPVRRVPDDHATIQDALDAIAGNGIVEITDNRRYEEALSVSVAELGHVELRSANERRAVLVLTSPLTITGAADAEFTLNGLLVAGNALEVPAGPTNKLARLGVTHATLVPGWALTEDGQPVQPTEPSLRVSTADTRVTVTRSIVGGVRLDAGAHLAAVDSIVDATTLTGIACAADDARAPGGDVAFDGCTVFGTIDAVAMPLVSNSILLADASGPPVRVEQRQTGCVRFSWVPLRSRTPRQFHCLPADNGAPAPRLLSRRYGTPLYGRLSAAADQRIRHGADDEGEMGVFHHLLGSPRETNLRLRLAEFLRAGLESGIFFEL
jgi:hypothetical protein